MNYVNIVRAKLIEEIPDELGRQDPAIIDFYTLLVLVKGKDTTMQDVHDAWAVWRWRTRPGHKDLVPFDKLSTDVAEWDRPFAEAIVRTAKAVSP